MKILVDTSIWSLGLRRHKPESTEARELFRLVREGLVEMIGPVRQEILSGIKHPGQFAKIRQDLSPFEDIALGRDHFETAAAFHNRCVRRGIQGSSTDFLLCAVAAMEGLAIFTTDLDFLRYAKVLPIHIHASAL